MSIREAMQPFVARPRSSAVLALLAILLGVIVLTDLVPTSPNRIYFYGHQWVLAGLCWSLAFFCATCAIKGLKERNK